MSNEESGPRKEPGIRYTRGPEAAAPSARSDVPPPRAVVLVESESLDAAGLRAAARVAGVELQAVQSVAAAGLPLVVRRCESLAEARTEALTLQGELPGAVAVDPLSMRPAWTLWVPLLALIASAPLPFLSLWPLVPLLWVLGLVGLVAGVAAGSKAQGKVKQSLLLLDRAERVSGSEQVQGLVKQARALRMELSRLDLADIVLRDLDGSLSELLGELGELGEKELRAPSGSPEREQVEHAYGRIREALDALAEVVRQASGGDASGAAERLIRQARALDATVSEVPDASAEVSLEERRRAARAQRLKS